jgi:hypothetical protein
MLKDFPQELPIEWAGGLVALAKRQRFLLPDRHEIVIPGDAGIYMLGIPACGPWIPACAGTTDLRAGGQR